MTTIKAYEYLDDYKNNENISDRNEKLIIERDKLRKDGWVEISPKKFIIFLNGHNFLRSDHPNSSVLGLIENIDNNYRKFFTTTEMFGSSEYIGDLKKWNEKLLEESDNYKQEHENDIKDDDFSMTAHYFGN
jgi:hypothetical protein